MEAKGASEETAEGDTLGPLLGTLVPTAGIAACIGKPRSISGLLRQERLPLQEGPLSGSVAHFARRVAEVLADILGSSKTVATPIEACGLPGLLAPCAATANLMATSRTGIPGPCRLISGALGCIAFSGEQRRRLRWPEQLPLSNLEETVFAKGSSTRPLIAPWALLRNAIGATGSSVGNRMAVHIVEVILQSTLALHFVRGFVGGSWHGDL